MFTRARSGEQRGVWWLVTVLAVWAIGWWVAPSIGVFSLGVWLFDQDAVAAIVLGSAVSVLVLGGLSAWQYVRGEAPWRYHWTMVLLAIPILLFAWLPFRVGGWSVIVTGVPLWSYMMMSAVHVTMQQYLTFEWLQMALERRMKPLGAIIVTGMAFYAIHAVLLPHKFAPIHLSAALAILTLGLGCALLRHKTGSIWASLALHLAFYGALL